MKKTFKDSLIENTMNIIWIYMWKPSSPFHLMTLGETNMDFVDGQIVITMDFDKEEEIDNG